MITHYTVDKGIAARRIRVAGLPATLTKVFDAKVGITNGIQLLTQHKFLLLGYAECLVDTEFKLQSFPGYCGVKS
jgi:hypothetical protein